jgi:hypothetical protein
VICNTHSKLVANFTLFWNISPVANYSCILNGKEFSWRTLLPFSWSNVAFGNNKNFSLAEIVVALEHLHRQVKNFFIKILN